MYLKGNDLDWQANQNTSMDWGPSLNVCNVHCGLITLEQLFAFVHELDRIDYSMRQTWDHEKGVVGLCVYVCVLVCVLMW